MLRSGSKSLGNHVVSPSKKKGCSGKDLQKRKVLSGVIYRRFSTVHFKYS